LIFELILLDHSFWFFSLGKLKYQQDDDWRLMVRLHDFVSDLICGVEIWIVSNQTWRLFWKKRDLYSIGVSFFFSPEVCNEVLIFFQLMNIWKLEWCLVSFKPCILFSFEIGLVLKIISCLIVLYRNPFLVLKMIGV
jgi:hypothetical protein